MTSEQTQVPLRVAVVGSGPAGFYAAETLLRSPETAAEVDLFDRLPTPYGLVRGGVAPDHQKIKSVTRIYERTAARPSPFPRQRPVRPRSAGRRPAGALQIVYATGNRRSPARHQRRVRLDLGRLRDWYNGHPDFREARIPSIERAVVVDNAVDVTRITR